MTIALLTPECTEYGKCIRTTSRSSHARPCAFVGDSGFPENGERVENIVSKWKNGLPKL